MAGMVSHDSRWLARCEKDKGCFPQEHQGLLDTLSLIQYTDFTVMGIHWLREASPV